MATFIFMLTRNDQTVPDARSIVPAIAASGVTHVGCKDVGLPGPELEALFADLRSLGCTTYLEVVSETPAQILESARAAVLLHPDFLIGGTELESVQAIIAGTGIRFFPYVGRIVGHPCLLRGTIEEIVADARRVERAGVDGINLLAYRYDGDVEALIGAVTSSVRIPVICAGSIDSAERIEAVGRLGSWGFTIGTALLDGAFEPHRTLPQRLERVLQLARA